MATSISRRKLLRRSALLALAGTPLLQACSDPKPSPVCVEPQGLSTGEKHMRSTLEYVELAAEESEQCESCQFFKAADSADSGGCGYCEILSGDVSRLGYCSSWARKMRS